MTWFDALLLLLALAPAALAAERRWQGVIISLSGVVLVWPLLLLGQRLPGVALPAGIILALLSVLAAGRVTAGRRQGGALSRIAGGLSGLLLGAVLLLAVVTGLPTGRTASGAVVYPPRDLPAGVQTTLGASTLMRYGRSVLLQPLLADEPGRDPAAEHAVTAWLHAWLVPDAPWNSGR
ncbi:MAG TPA: hypothetical protein VK092_09130 [Deinococcales bacterium]|nr:hypothetical protein [Deinococcales bacterium]